MTRYIEFLEGDRTYWLLLDGNRDEVARLRRLLAKARAAHEYRYAHDFPFTLGVVRDESVVDRLVARAAAAGYRDAHNKVTGLFRCPDSLGEYAARLRGGQICGHFTAVTR